MGQQLPSSDVNISELMARLDLIERAVIGSAQLGYGSASHLQSIALPESFGRMASPRSFDEGRAAAVRKIIKGRRARERFFADSLFADPAWDIMLDLYAAHYEGRQVSVSSLCIASAVPGTTGLRWIKTMTDDGLLVRVDDQADGRRVFIKLSDEARIRLDAYFDSER